MQDKDVNKFHAQARERLKELEAINHTTQILYEGRSIEETLSRIVDILPPAWQYPGITCAKIEFNGQIFRSGKFKKSKFNGNGKK